MRLKKSILLGCAVLFTMTSCGTSEKKKSWSEKAVENSRAQIGMEIEMFESRHFEWKRRSVLLWICRLAEWVLPWQRVVSV